MFYRERIDRKTLLDLRGRPGAWVTSRQDLCQAGSSRATMLIEVAPASDMRPALRPGESSVHDVRRLKIPPTYPYQEVFQIIWA